MNAELEVDDSGFPPRPQIPTRSVAILGTRSTRIRNFTLLRLLLRIDTVLGFAANCGFAAFDRDRVPRSGQRGDLVVNRLTISDAELRPLHHQKHRVYFANNPRAQARAVLKEIIDAGRHMNGLKVTLACVPDPVK